MEGRGEGKGKEEEGKVKGRGRGREGKRLVCGLSVVLGIDLSFGAKIYGN